MADGTVKENDTDRSGLNLELASLGLIVLIIIILLFAWFFYRMSYYDYQEIANDIGYEPDPVPKNQTGKIYIDDMERVANQPHFISLEDGRSLSYILTENPNESFSMPVDGTKIGVVANRERNCIAFDGSNLLSCTVATWVIKRVVGDKVIILNTAFPATCISSTNPSASFVEERIIYGARSDYLNLFEFIPMQNADGTYSETRYMIRKAGANDYISFRETVDYQGRSYLQSIYYTPNKGTIFRISLGGGARYIPFTPIVPGRRVILRQGNYNGIMVQNNLYRVDTGTKKTIRYYTFKKAGKTKFQNGSYIGYSFFLWEYDSAGNERRVCLTKPDLNWTDVVTASCDDVSYYCPDESFMFLGKSDDSSIPDEDTSLYIAPHLFFHLSFMKDGLEYICQEMPDYNLRMLNQYKVDPFKIVSFVDSTGYCIGDSGVCEPNEI